MIDGSTITAIVVTHDSAGVLPVCLAALKRAGVPVLVVDNASTDDTVLVARRAGARVLVNARNEGYGRGNTLGIRAAETPFCLVLNPDIELDEGAAAALLDAAARYPDAAMLAPRIIEPDGRLFFQNRSFLRESLVNGVVCGDARAHAPEGDVCAPFLSGACFMIRRDEFLALGGFDPNIFLFYEDDDLCRRLSDRGRALVHVQEALATHVRGGSAAPRPGRRYRARWHMGWSRVYIARKYGLPHGALATLAQNLPKALLARLAFSRPNSERYGGMADGTWAALRGRSALAREGLSVGLPVAQERSE